MNPIVSPWVFYAIEVADNILSIMKIVGIITLFVLFPLTTVYAEEKKGSKDFKRIRNLFYAAVLVFCISMIMIIFVPSKQTAYTMLIAQYTTTDNIERVGGTAEKAIQKLADIIIKTANEMEKGRSN